MENKSKLFLELLAFSYAFDGIYIACGRHTPLSDKQRWLRVALQKICKRIKGMFCLYLLKKNCIFYND